jgi:hypothetical protein
MRLQRISFGRSDIPPRVRSVDCRGGAALQRMAALDLELSIFGPPKQDLRATAQQHAEGAGGAVRYDASFSRCASGSASSFFSVLFSIWRIRSRVTPKARPTSSSVRAFWPLRP